MDCRVRQGVSDLQLQRAQVAWVITGMEFGSAVVTTAATWTSLEGELAAKQCQSNVIAAISRFRRSGDFGHSVSTKTASHLRGMFRVIGEAGIPMVQIWTKNEVVEVRTAVDGIGPRPATVRFEGSIEGEIVAISVAHRPVLTVRERIHNILVPCYFDHARWLETARGALLRHVLIGGEVTYRQNGEPISLTEITALEVYPDDAELPAPSDVYGIDPLFTDGLPTEEWLAKQRG